MPKSRYLPIAVLFADPPGIAPLDCKIDLIEGVRITGRVTDQRTGKPVQGTIEYRPLAPNSYFARLGDDVDLPLSLSGGTPLDKDGTYELQAMPGPGFIAVRCRDAGYTLPRIDLKEVNRILGGSEAARRRQQRGIPDDRGISAELVRVAAVAIQSLGADQSSRRSRGSDAGSRAGARAHDLGPCRRPGRSAGFAEPRVAGLGFDNGEPRYEVLDDAQFTVRGVSPNESRNLLFFYPQKRLGAHIEIANGNEAPLTVGLQPCATADRTSSSRRMGIRCQEGLSSCTPATAGEMPAF